MARYDYQCPECSYKAEIENPISQPLPEVECEECNVTMKRVIYATPAIFTGGGWGGK